jgi:tryptophanase
MNIFKIGHGIMSNTSLESIQYDVLFKEITNTNSSYSTVDSNSAAGTTELHQSQSQPTHDNVAMDGVRRIHVAIEIPD